MPQAIRIFLIATVFVCCALGIGGQQPAVPELPKGKTIDKVVVEYDKSQSYALYLPSNYDQLKKFPILYSFDPASRGRVAVEKFRTAAEKYGYIVVGSNNSQNGLDSKDLSAIISNLWDETHRRFSIDEKRVLAAGFSGGARVASSLANACGGCIFGVIGSGAGFSSGVAINEKLPFLFFGAVGYDDFNYYELRDLGKKLATARITHRVETFDGSHQWLDEALGIETLGWFEIRAMKAGRRVKDDGMIDGLFQANIRKADEFLAEKKYIEAYSAYLRIVDDFGAWRDVSSLKAKIIFLKSSTELKEAVKSDADQIRTQQREVGEIIALVDKLRDDAERVDARGKIREKIGSLQKKADEPNDDAQRRVARRSLNQIFASTFESAVFRYEREGKLDLAANNLEVAAEVYPKSPQIHFDRARIYALQGEKKKAIEALTTSVDLGMRDIGRIRSEKSFETLQKDKRFLDLLAGLERQ